MNSIKSNLSIKSVVIKKLMESKEPFFYLAPDVVGSINNAYSDNKKQKFIVDFNTNDQLNMKLVVPMQVFKNWSSTPNIDNGEGMAMSFLKKYLEGVKPCDNIEGDEMLGEMVDEFGNLYDDSDDKPANIKGAPGYDNKRSGQDATKQYTSQYTRLISPLGYGGVVW